MQAFTYFTITSFCFVLSCVVVILFYVFHLFPHFSVLCFVSSARIYFGYRFLHFLFFVLRFTEQDFIHHIFPTYFSLPFFFLFLYCFQCENFLSLSFSLLFVFFSFLAFYSRRFRFYHHFSYFFVFCLVSSAIFNLHHHLSLLSLLRCFQCELSLIQPLLYIFFCIAVYTVSLFHRFPHFLFCIMFQCENFLS